MPARPDLLDGLSEAIRDPHPLALLDIASMLAIATESDPMAELRAQMSGRPERNRIARAELIESFLDVGERETDALLLVWAHMLGDEAPVERIRREVRARRHPLPRWIHHLDEVRPTRVVQLSHVLNDGDNMFIGVETPGRSFTIVLYIDHNMGTIPKDGYAVDRPIGELIGFSESQNLPDTTMTELLLEDARARLEEVLLNESRLLDPFENDGWPGTRPLLQWMVRLMPDGGEGYDRPEWTEAQLSALVDEFTRSPFGADADSDTLDRVRMLLQFASSYGRADPLHWSGVVAEIMLVDLIPRKVMASQKYLRGMPDAIRRVIRFAHAQRGVPAIHTDAALAAVDEFAPHFRQQVAGGASRGRHPLHDIVDDATMGLDDATFDEFLLRDAAAQVGGFDALTKLDDAPLPDERLALAAIPDAAAGAAAEVDDVLDRACSEFFGSIELRTAARRMLVQIARADPHTIVRGKPLNTAAAICFIIGHANGQFNRHARDRLTFTIKDLLTFLGVKNPPNDRASGLLHVLGINYYEWQETGYPLGDAELLIAARRAELIGQRDRVGAFG
ncbi:MAG: DUF6398 domain-containing protein [Microbacterium sp.]